MRERYVLGFYFSHDRTRLLLIEKQKPVWQAGKLNGIGGKVEANDWGDAIDAGVSGLVIAMCREFREEVGLITEPADWREVTTLEGENWEVTVFVGFGHPDSAQHREVEQPVVVETAALPQHLIPNLRWLIPMVLDNEVQGGRVLY